jgi:hypothetical protein
MAVVQISRIQVRRGKRNSGTGLPQLASGELAWALDTQELYIGNGAVAEGSPAVGNTKILTELDLNANGNILNLLQYIYKVTDTGMRTGPNSNAPTTRSLQARFDDRVTTTDFGTVGDGTTDDTVELQRAIDQLFLNTTRTKSSVGTADGVSTRIVLNLPAGIFKTTGTLYIPSYATLVGAGSQKTIISYTGTGPAIQFIDDASTPLAGVTPANYISATTSSTLYTTQPHNIIIKGLTVLTNTTNQTGIQLDSVRDSVFEDVSVEGLYVGVYNANSKGIAMTAVSSLVTCERNVFSRVKILGFTFGVYAKEDIKSNTFNECYLTKLRHGFFLGAKLNDTLGNILEDADGSTPGEQFGPRNTIISNCVFGGQGQDGIYRHAVYVGIGTGNTVRDSSLINVGNEAGGNLLAKFPQVYFNQASNSVDNLQSDRSLDLAEPQYALPYFAVPYVPEVSGYGTYKSFGIRRTNNTLGQRTDFALDDIVFRLPVATQGNGTPWHSISYSIEYVYRSTASEFTRRGTMKLAVDVDDGLVQLSDDYEVIGSTLTETDSLKLEFRARLLNQNGTYFTGVGNPYSIAIEYKNTLNADTGVFTYSYTSSF